MRRLISSLTAPQPNEFKEKVGFELIVPLTGSKYIFVIFQLPCRFNVAFPLKFFERIFFMRLKIKTVPQCEEIIKAHNFIQCLVFQETLKFS